MTIFFGLSFHLIYSGVNALYHKIIVNEIDAFNITLGIFITMIMLMVMIMLWTLTYRNKLQTFDEILSDVAINNEHS